LFACDVFGDSGQETTSVAPWLLFDETDAVEAVSFTDPLLTAGTNTTSTVTNASIISTTPVCHVSQHFDGASFVGGIVLALGTVAILCFARLFFKARTNNQYNTV